MYQVIYYSNKRGDSPVEAFICSLQLKVRAKVLKWLELLEEQGSNLPRPYADMLRDKIRELRISHGKLEIRLLYFFWKDKIIVVTNGFFKKDKQTDNSEINKAINYMNDFMVREGER
jgi:phage-related protein